MLSVLFIRNRLTIRKTRRITADSSLSELVSATRRSGPFMQCVTLLEFFYAASHARVFLQGEIRSSPLSISFLLL